MFSLWVCFAIFTEGTAMNSLILTLDAGAGCCLPIAYQQLTQGALYAAWRGSYPQLHDDGFDGGGQIFRLFTFGPLAGREAAAHSKAS